MKNKGKLAHRESGEVNSRTTYVPEKGAVRTELGRRKLGSSFHRRQKKNERKCPF